MMSALIKERRDDTEGKGREGHVRTETQITVIWSWAKECLVSTEAQRGKEGFHTRGFRVSVALWTPWSQTFSLHNCERINLCCFKLPHVFCPMYSVFLFLVKIICPYLPTFLKFTFIFTLYWTHHSLWSSFFQTKKKKINRHSK